MPEEKETPKTSEVDHAKLELVGKIYYVEKDVDGNTISRCEIDGETAMRALVNIINESVANITDDDNAEEEDVVEIN